MHFLEALAAFNSISKMVSTKMALAGLPLALLIHGVAGQAGAYGQCAFYVMLHEIHDLAVCYVHSELLR